MRNAIEAVRSGDMTANRAASGFEVPPTTLKDRLSGRVRHGTNPGPKPYLTKQEEDELAEFLIKASTMGYGKSKREVLSIVKRTLENKGSNVDDFIGEGWWMKFMKRHPRLSLRTSDPLSRVRRNAVTEENMQHYFSLLRKTLEEHDLLNKASRIYNMDETGMPLDAKQLKRVALKGVKKIQGPSSGNKSQITVVACGNAAGHTIAPMVIFKGERFNHEWTVGEVPDTLYGMSDSGWIDKELFFLWLKNIFIKRIPPQRPVLLLYDGHSLHYTPDAITEAAKEGIVIFCLPPNTTHAAQPLDVSFFKPLKIFWSLACHSFLADHPNAVVTKLQFSGLFNEAWTKACKPSSVIAGFKKTGICPLDPNAIKIIPAFGEVSHLQGGNGQQDPLKSTSSHQTDLENSSMDTLSSSNDCLSSQLSKEQLELFERRYENGYDVYEEEDYVTWLQIHHPASLPDDLKKHNSDTASIVSSHSDTLLMDLSQLGEETSSGDKRISILLDETDDVSPPSTSLSLLGEETSSRDKRVSILLDQMDDESPPSTSLSLLGEETSSGDKRISILLDETDDVSPPSTSLSLLGEETSSGDKRVSILLDQMGDESPPSTSNASCSIRPNDENTPPNSAKLSSASRNLQETRKVLSDITGFLTLPTNTSQSKKPPGPARVLTSEESLLMLREKEEKKIQEEEEKQKRKQEREKKRQEKEAEKKKKAEERERKASEKQRMSEEKKAKQEAKNKLAMEKKREREKNEGNITELEIKRLQREIKRQEKHKIPWKVFTTRSQTASASQATGASHKLSNSDNICCLCSGKYDDDISSDGILVKEWIQCTEDKCKLWMHEECAAESNDEFVCACGNTFQ